MRFHPKQPVVSEMDMTPLIDVVFQLITFFMLVINFEQTEADERVKLPRDELARPPIVQRSKELTLNIGYRRDIEGEKLSGPLVFYAGEEMTLDQMVFHLQQEKRLFEDVGTKPADVTVVIRADEEIPTGMVQDLIRIAQEATFEKFSLRATQKIEQ
jgi:biopolymer transport protein ExbD